MCNQLICSKTAFTSFKRTLIGSCALSSCELVGVCSLLHTKCVCRWRAGLSDWTQFQNVGQFAAHNELLRRHPSLSHSVTHVLRCVRARRPACAALGLDRRKGSMQESVDDTVPKTRTLYDAYRNANKVPCKCKQLRKGSLCTSASPRWQYAHALIIAAKRE